MSETLEQARTMLAVARHTVASLLLDYEPEHQRVRDARESVRGWALEVERLERREEAGVLAVARLTAGARPSGASEAVLGGFDSHPATRSPAVSCVCGDPGDCQGCAA